MSQKIQSFKLEPALLSATLLATCLGGAAAWAATGAFSMGLFLVVAALGVAAQAGLQRLRLDLPWLALPLLVMVVYWTQAGRLDWTVVWSALILAAMWAWRLPAAARFGNRSDVAVYVLLLTGVAVGNIPVWCLLCLLPAPLAWRAHKSADAAISEEWAIVTGMFLIAGYLIKGLIR